MTSEIIIRGARLHNLKNINLSIPKNQVVVLTGISGSGKSTIGFDILFKESQRQFMEALGLVSFGWVTGLAQPVERILHRDIRLLIRNGRTNSTPMKIPKPHKKPFPARIVALLFRNLVWQIFHLINRMVPAPPVPDWESYIRLIFDNW
jgi:ABC-type antimicrobial peptide transport system ATPase subunit